MVTSAKARRSLISNLASDVKEGKIPVKTNQELASVRKKDLQTSSPIPKEPLVQEQVTSGESIPNEDKVIHVKPSKIKPWQFKDRVDAEYGDLRELADSIKNNGQLVPVIVRTSEDPDFDFELIAGGRRLRAITEYLDIDISCVVRELSDIEAAKVQKVENDDREDLSNYSKAVNYKQMLDAHIYESASKLAASLDIPRQTFSDLMGYTKIPQDVIDAIQAVGNMKCISVRMSTVMQKLCNDPDKGPEYTQAIVELAPRIAKGTIQANALKNIIASTSRTKPQKTVVKGEYGSAFSIRHDSNGIPTFSILKDGRNLLTTEEITQVLTEAFDRKYSEMSKVD